MTLRVGGLFVVVVVVVVNVVVVNVTVVVVVVVVAVTVVLLLLFSFCRTDSQIAFRSTNIFKRRVSSDGSAVDFGLEDPEFRQA